MTLYYNDAPKPWGLFFQDSASPQMEALIELHDIIFFYLMLVLFMVSYILLSIIINFFHKNWLISNKYLNHGQYVPNQKCFNFSKINYSTNTSKNDEEIEGICVYDDPLTTKKILYKENKGKSGIYLWLNKESGLKYIGQSINISNRMGSYFSNSYLKSKQNLFICRVLLKHGHKKFKLIIL